MAKIKVEEYFCGGQCVPVTSC